MLGNLYILKQQVLDSLNVYSSVNDRERISDVWDNRLGHAPLAILRYAKLNVLDSLNKACVINLS